MSKLGGDVFSGNSHSQNPTNDAVVSLKHFDTLALSVASSTVNIDDVLDITNRTAGVGEARQWDAVDITTVTVNGSWIVAHSNPAIALVLRPKNLTSDTLAIMIADVNVQPGDVLEVINRTAGVGKTRTWDAVAIGTVTTNGDWIVAHSDTAVAVVLRPKDVAFPTAAAALADVNLQPGDLVHLLEHSTGNGGSGRWKVVLESTVTTNISRVLQTGIAALAIEFVGSRKVSVRQLGMTSSAADKTTLMQEIITDSPNNFTIRVDNVDVKISLSLAITNKSDFRITGNGRVFIEAGATVMDMFRVSGTITNLEIDTLRLEGENNATYTQYAIGNFSGAVVNGYLVHHLKLTKFNSGISFNADLGGIMNECHAYHNKLSQFAGGVLPGIGYGLHFARAENSSMYRNIVDGATRHSIYQAKSPVGRAANNEIYSNIILNHRLTVASGEFRQAISVSRTIGAKIHHNLIKDYSDGAMIVDHDTASVDFCQDIEIYSNTFTGRKNLVPHIVVGEQLDPTTVIVSDITIMYNLFKSDVSVVNATGINILNGRNIKVMYNDIEYEGITSSLTQFVELGSSTFATTDADIQDIVVMRNTVKTNAAIAGSRFAFVSTRLCNGSSRYIIKDNEIDGFANHFAFEVTPTNVNSKLKWTQEVVVDVPSLAAHTGNQQLLAINGVKSTTTVTGLRPQHSLIPASAVYQAFAQDTGVNSVSFQTNNVLATTYDPPSQTFILSFEDY